MEDIIEKAKKRTFKGVKVGILPKEHYFSHAFCFRIHDLIAQTLVEGDKSEVFLTKYTVPREKLNSFNSEKDTIKWLAKNGYGYEALTVIYKTIIKGLMSDFCHFVYEALDCSQKGKLSVTFALLRKAFKDHLLYFEWVLGDIEEFMHIFIKGNIEELALDRNMEKKKEIIRKAMNRLSPYWENAEIIYGIRYDKKSNISLEPWWQQASHLVTSCAHYKTTPLNFNFIFSTFENKKSQWTILYNLLPILLTHAYHIIEAIFQNFSEREKTDITDLKVLAGFLILNIKSRKNGRLKEIISSCDLEKIPCPKCNVNLKINKKNAMNIFYNSYMKCVNCKYKFLFSTNSLTEKIVKKMNLHYYQENQ